MALEASSVPVETPFNQSNNSYLNCKICCEISKMYVSNFLYLIQSRKGNLGISFHVKSSMKKFKRKITDSKQS